MGVIVPVGVKVGVGVIVGVAVGVNVGVNVGVGVGSPVTIQSPSIVHGFNVLVYVENSIGTISDSSGPLYLYQSVIEDMQYPENLPTPLNPIL